MYLSAWGAGEDDYRTEQVCARPDLHHDRYTGSASALGNSAPEGETDQQRDAREDAEAQAKKAKRARMGPLATRLSRHPPPDDGGRARLASRRG